MLSIQDIVVKYDSIAVLKGVSMEIRQGEIVALIGGNGAGKTTTLRTISGLMHPVSGSITFEGTPIGKMESDKIVSMGIVHVPEGRQIFADMTIEENLILGTYLQKDDGLNKQNRERVLDLFPILGQRQKQLAGTLSGGEQQMLAIGRAMMGNPKLLLLDEPSMGLSPLMTQTVFDAIQKLHEDGITILLVEQNAYEALEISHRAYILETGNVTLEGPSTELIENPKVQSAYLGGE